MITIAIPTGYLLPGALRLLGGAGLAELTPEDLGRKLILRPTDDLTLVTVRPLDVAAYVDHGSADLGIVGKDALWETERVHYELLDLGFGGCRLVMATPEESGIGGRETWPPFLRVATKYIAASRRYFEAQGQEVELIKLYGSVELAPLTGLADAVVDLTATGTTLRENRLREVAEVGRSTARLIANQVSLRTRGAEVQVLITPLRGGHRRRRRAQRRRAAGMSAAGRLDVPVLSAEEWRRRVPARRFSPPQLPAAALERLAAAVGRPVIDAAAGVDAIIGQVRDGGDAALRRLTAMLDGAQPTGLELPASRSGEAASKCWRRPSAPPSAPPPSASRPSTRCRSRGRWRSAPSSSCAPSRCGGLASTSPAAGPAIPARC